MPPNKSKRCRDESPEMERRSKRPREDDDSDDTEISETGVSKAGCAGAGGLKSPVASHNKPAELFRKDLISAMKLADSEQLDSEAYLLIADPWRQEWEKGVQVPVNDDAIPEAVISEVRTKDKGTGDFKMPRKFLHGVKDETYQQGNHELTGMQQLSEQVVRYDLDDLDVTWLRRINDEREELGEILIDEWIMEKIIEVLETQCHENMQLKKKTEEGLGIEYDEDIVCAVCASPESEECNEMVFCDGCDICVHQACYGIQKIPEGSWLCRTCALGIKPICILCPKSGGAMKSTRSGTKWAHVSCALWIPEVSIGCVEKMEPVTKISQIPASRWALICCICKERCGACIQCSVKACKTAFHVSCAFQGSLEMKTILTDDTADDGGVKLKAYCPRHSKNGEGGNSESDCYSPRKAILSSSRKELTDEEIAKMRAEKLQCLNEEFYSVISVEDIARTLDLDESAVEQIFVYWKIKRKTHFDVPFLTPKTEEEDLLEKQQEDSLVARMKMFVQLRQDLERVRNLCYMVSKREKIKKQFYKSRESVFMAIVDVFSDPGIHLTDRDINRIKKKYQFDSIYDPMVFQNLKYRSEPVEVSSQDDEEDMNSSVLMEDSQPEEITPFQSDFVDKDLFSKPSKSEHRETPIRRHLLHKKRKSREARRSSMISHEEEKKFSEGEEDEMVHNSQSHNDHRTLRSTRKSTKGSNSGDEKDISAAEVEVEPSYNISPDKYKPKIFVDESVVKKESKDNRIVSSPLKEIKKESLGRDGRGLRSSTAKFENGEPDFSNLAFSSKRNKVSDRIKAELTYYMKNSKLVVPEQIRQKVQRGLLKNRVGKKFTNGVHDKSQRKLDSYFRNGHKADTTVNNRSTDISRVLNEISPSRTRQSSENNHIYGTHSSPRGSLSGYKIPKKTTPNGTPDRLLEKSLDCNTRPEMSPVRETRSVRRKIDNVFDIFSQDSSRRSSRENSPDSRGEGIPCLRGIGHHDLNSDRVITRSCSPTVSYKSDTHGEFIDVENVFQEGDNTHKRVTRSQMMESDNSRDSISSLRNFVS